MLPLPRTSCPQNLPATNPVDTPRTGAASPTQDVVLSEPTCDNPRRHAQNWRSTTTVQQLPTEHVDVRPPSYAVHTTQPTPSEHGSEHIITPSTVPIRLPQCVCSPPHAKTIGTRRSSSQCMLHGRQGPARPQRAPTQCRPTTRCLRTKSGQMGEDGMSIVARPHCHTGSLP